MEVDDTRDSRFSRMSVPSPVPLVRLTPTWWPLSDDLLLIVEAPFTAVARWSLAFGRALDGFVQIPLHPTARVEVDTNLLRLVIDELYIGSAVHLGWPLYATGCTVGLTAERLTSRDPAAAAEQFGALLEADSAFAAEVKLREPL
ncbi:MAG: hypothetical protein HOV87_11950 [Catenulispora sp.]|nr:hypothetical protein [Catenulispora sp.]NUT40037.1 hypothetical protein [Thermoactinospora sp.]